MIQQKLLRFGTISQLHKFRKLPAPEHPLISLIDLEKTDPWPLDEPAGLVCDFYSISIKYLKNASLQYGQLSYDFDHGTMFLMSPEQVWALKPDEGENPHQTGYVLLIHPDLLWRTPLAAKIKTYDYFSYQVNEALFLSGKEEKLIKKLIMGIMDEVYANTDRFSQELIVAHLDVLLTYIERFYTRQFLTRRKASHHLLEKMETLIGNYLSTNKSLLLDALSVNSIADQLNVSAGYLSSLHKTYTGVTAQQYIHSKLIAVAKDRLSLSSLTVSEIAFQLGFQHTQSFCRFFKTATAESPMQFRRSLLN
ncbi:helix-turn-helix domain-containing protein [Pedobacter mucosus]|uniref:helix-turn-helix domain-containing protein n=1 Tax=Pedobacter mucosus TaxID=2895286 RepID=UPI001EE3E949|nr:helix-turn-helix transcriptional regulator [Pedobacter mucosus]UKT65967.1 helix-turn-helix transcriptional regulator [Pedobacter mucosus]